MKLLKSQLLVFQSMIVFYLSSKIHPCQIQYFEFVQNSILCLAFDMKLRLYDIFCRFEIHRFIYCLCWEMVRFPLCD